ncbi:hypothetical protein PG984_000357 [Apiospora sp. TS-2023a]
MSYLPRCERGATTATPKPVQPPLPPVPTKYIGPFPHIELVPGSDGIGGVTFEVLFLALLHELSHAYAQNFHEGRGVEARPLDVHGPTFRQLHTQMMPEVKT